MKGLFKRDLYIRTRIVPPIAQALWLIGGICGLCTIIEITKVYVHLSKRISTNGEIISYAEVPGTERFHPTIRFRDINGIEHEFIDSTGATTPLYLVGTIVQVDYHPQQPMVAEMSTMYYRWGASIGIFFLSIICWFLGSRFTYKV